MDQKTEKKNSGAGGKLARSKIIQARLSPKLHFTAEIFSRLERRTISSLIEALIEEAENNYRVTVFDAETGSPTVCYLQEAMDQIWHANESVRLVGLALLFPSLLNEEEERIWDLIVETPYFWSCYPVQVEGSAQRWEPVYSLKSLVKHNLYEYWEYLKTENAKLSELPKDKPGKITTKPEVADDEQEIIDNELPLNLKNMTERHKAEFLEAAELQAARYRALHQGRSSKIGLPRHYLQAIVNQLMNIPLDEDEPYDD